MSLKKWFWQRQRHELEEPLAEIPEHLWDKCPQCQKLVYLRELEANLKVCPHCQHHYRLTAWERLAITVDEESFEEYDAHLLPADPLRFPGYREKVLQDRKQTGLNDAIVTGAARIGGHPVLIGVMDFRFRGASMGSVVGEKVTRQMERAIEQQKPLILFCTSGGARMHEGLFSLMQMAKTAAAAARLHQAGVPYFAVFTDPTTAGVLASYASLADVILAEPGALIGFTGARVIEQNLRIKLPPEFQKAEFQQEHGMVDLVVPRSQIRDTLILLLRFAQEAPGWRREMEAAWGEVIR